MHHSSLAAALCLPLLALAGGVQAADNGYYFGAGAGAARSELGSEFRNTLSSGYGTVRLSEDKTDFAARALLGYRFTPNFSIQGAFGHYGRVEGRAGTTLPLGTVNTERETRALTLGIVARLPVSERLDLTASAGAAFWKTGQETTTVLPVSNVAVRDTRTQTGASPLLGLGMQFRLTENTRLSFDVEHFRTGKDGNSGISRANVNAVFAGLSIHF